MRPLPAEEPLRRYRNCARTSDNATIRDVQATRRGACHSVLSIALAGPACLNTTHRFGEGDLCLFESVSVGPWPRAGAYASKFGEAILAQCI